MRRRPCGAGCRQVREQEAQPGLSRQHDAPRSTANDEQATAPQEALRKDISEVYGTCPVDYSDDDWRILAGVQTVVCDEVEKFWRAHEASEAGVVTAARTPVPDAAAALRNCRRENRPAPAKLVVPISITLAVAVQKIYRKAN